MQYVFRNSASSRPVTASLGSSGMTLDDGNSISSVLYSAISRVKLMNNAGHFFVDIERNGESSVRIGSRFYRNSHDFDDYSRAYLSFVRILHYHLKQVEGVVYLSSQKHKRVWLFLPLAALASFALAFLMYSLKVELFSPIMMASVLSVLFVSYIVVMRSGLSRRYDPTKIPFDCIPREMT